MRIITEYNAKDIIQLQIILSNDLGGTDDFVYLYWEEVIKKLRVHSSQKSEGISSEDIKVCIVNWLRHYYDTPANQDYDAVKKIVKFLFYTEYEDLPLFINDSFLKPFVSWRIKINK